MSRGSRIAGVGAYLPRTVIRNEFFGDTLRKAASRNLDDLFDGVEERRHASPEESSIFMGIEAGRAALQRAALEGKDIDYVLSAAMAPDYVVPGDGHFIAHALGVTGAPVQTLDTACASFIPMMVQADLLIKSGRAKRVLLLATCNWVNRVIDKERNHVCLGDGAGAMVMEASDEDALLSFREATALQWANAVQVKAPWATGAPGYFRFESSDEYREFNLDGKVVEVARECLLECRRREVRPRWNILGQSGMRLIETWTRNLELPPEQNLNTFRFTGNLAAANLPVILNHFVYDDVRIKKGDVVLIFAPGAGVYTAAMAWRF